MFPECSPHKVEDRLALVPARGECATLRDIQHMHPAQCVHKWLDRLVWCGLVDAKLASYNNNYCNLRTFGLKYSQ
jgi:hypothetical protein